MSTGIAGSENLALQAGTPRISVRAASRTSGMVTSLPRWFARNEAERAMLWTLPPVSSESVREVKVGVRWSLPAMVCRARRTSSSVRTVSAATAAMRRL